MQSKSEDQNVSLKDINQLVNTGKLSETDLRVLEKQLIHLEKLKTRELAQEKFIKFVHRVWPTFISGRHHKRMAEAFERVARGGWHRISWWEYQNSDTDGHGCLPVARNFLSLSRFEV